MTIRAQVTAGEFTPYHAETHPTLRGWCIVDPAGSTVDVVGTALAAAYEVDLLNAGAAHVNPHGCLGCRVVLNAKEAA